eukprot:Phypoly_transcript_22190.p1 GENE.Phypoly_transcript_22190~~Phypoly_transcript_22190.p1  ORF type:complete len:173 (+),score=29.71 Phypoly_transcript_22190:79-597(+)
MFFEVALDREVKLHPQHLGPNLRHQLKQQLHQEVEGTCSGRYGFIIMVTKVEDTGKGKVQEGTGFVVYQVKFNAIVFKPFKGEVLDAVVTQVDKMGFFAEAGPLQIFVSKHLIPPEINFDPQSNPPAFVSEDETIRISKDDEVRLKIVGTRVDATEIFSIGSIKEDYLGLIS